MHIKKYLLPHPNNCLLYLRKVFTVFFVCQFHLEINLSFSVRPPSNIFDSEIQGKWIIWINLKCLNKIVRIKSLSMFDSNIFKLIHDICRLQLPLTSLNFKPFNGTWSRFIFNCSADLFVEANWVNCFDII